MYLKKISIQRRAKPYSPNPPVYGLIRRVTPEFFCGLRSAIFVNFLVAISDPNFKSFYVFDLK